MCNYQKKYRLAKLGYKKCRSGVFSIVDTAKRVAVIFDHTIHKKPVKKIITDHAINYSTLRHILIQYYLFGRTDVRKYKPSRYVHELYQ